MNLKISFCFFLACFVSGCSWRRNPPCNWQEQQNISQDQLLSTSELFSTLEEITALSENLHGENSPDENSKSKNLCRLATLSQHPDYLVRIRATKGLGKPIFRQTDLGYRALVRALNDEHWLVRSFSVKALGQCVSEDVTKLLQARAVVETHFKVKGYIEQASAAAERNVSTDCLKQVEPDDSSSSRSEEQAPNHQ